MVKLWISDKLELRWNEWPDINKWHPGHGMKEDFMNAVARAKKESILVEFSNKDRERLGLPCNCDCHKPGVMVMHFMPCCHPKIELKPDSFIEIDGKVEFVKQWKSCVGWADCESGEYIDQEIRTIARLKPQNSGHGYSEGADVSHYYEKAHTAEDDTTEEFTASQQKCCDLLINELMQKWHMPMGQARDVGRDIYFRFIYNRKYESEVHDLQQQLDAANKKIAVLEERISKMQPRQCVYCGSENLTITEESDTCKDCGEVYE